VRLKGHRAKILISSDRSAVRYVGEPVTTVVAQTFAAAMDAAERVEMVYEPVAGRCAFADALSPGAPLV
jgi:aerobic carbon-monoxide dehydrogenase large subunit